MWDVKEMLEIGKHIQLKIIFDSFQHNLTFKFTLSDSSSSSFEILQRNDWGSFIKVVRVVANTVPPTFSRTQESGEASGRAEGVGHEFPSILFRFSEDESKLRANCLQDYTVCIKLKTKDLKVPKNFSLIRKSVRNSN